MDIRIIGVITMSKGETTNISELRNTLECYALTLYKHLEYLEKWGLIVDKKPTRNGVARKITLARTYGDCMDVLITLKHAIETVNEYFG